MIFFEVIAMVFSVGGATVLSLSSRIFSNKIIIAYNMFFISGMFLLVVSALNNLGFLFIQTLLFAVVSLIVIFSEERVKAVSRSSCEDCQFRHMLHIYLIYISLILMAIMISLYVYLSSDNGGNIGLKYNNVEALAALLAIVGSYVMKLRIHRYTLIGFSLFIFADIMYVLIAIDNSMLYFGIQSLFFVFISTFGISNTIKDNKIKG